MYALRRQASLATALSLVVTVPTLNVSAYVVAWMDG